MDHGSAKIGDKTFGFLIVSDGATPHLTAYPCKRTSPSEVIAQLHEWMDTSREGIVQIWLSIILMTCRHSIDCSVKRLPTGPHSPWPNRAEMGVRLFKKFLLTLVNTASEHLDQTTVTDHSCPVDVQSSSDEKYTGDPEWQDAHGFVQGAETKRSPGPSVHESRAADIYVNQTRPPQ